MISMKTLWYLLSILVLSVTTSLSIAGFLETKSSASEKYEKLSKRIDIIEVKTEKTNTILCATAIELNWPTVQKACGVR